MSSSVPGQLIGSDTYAAQKAAGDAFIVANPDIVHLPTQEKADLLAGLVLQLLQIQGDAIITHAPSCEVVTSPPNSGAGLDRPYQPATAFAIQRGVGDTFIALWMKTGPGAQDWLLIGDGGIGPIKRTTIMIYG